MKHGLIATAESLIDDISADPVNWRAHEERLRQVIAAHERMNKKLPAHLRVYQGWLAEDDTEDSFSNLPI